MFFIFCLCRLSVLCPATQTIFLVGEKNEANGMLWFVSKCMKCPKHFYCLNDAGAIIMRALRWIPTIQVSTYGYELVGEFRAGQFANYIMADRIRQEFPARFEIHLHFLTSEC